MNYCKITDLFKRVKETANDGVREEIIAGAELAFQKYGYSRVTMQDISKEAKKVRSTVYKYFGNKNEVLDAVAIKIMSAIIQDCLLVISKEQSFAINVEKYFSLKLEKIKGLMVKYELLMADLKADPAVILTRSRIMLDDELAVMNEMILWAIENKDIKPLNEEDRMFLAETLYTAFKSFEIDIMLFERFPKYDQKLSWLAQMLHKGLS
ncbi:TetR/AcrR family transcriptional regulator [Mucilaginibacter roseus]|uniref:TetR/AcrR family transcriptional regulator n=1 Tax=Mucilaginibacter roseus TaxID=1528868 RepID=A0ABS8U0Z2_9SPHI|nr:TetR/AcrR family transcriptional regulator [Mucilaginibacter roseus]MCD8740785.1 TetR/AcrR family transcriptional regulator [Mucilaginibacter roseus]